MVNPSSDAVPIDPSKHRHVRANQAFTYRGQQIPNDRDAVIIFYTEFTATIWYLTGFGSSETVIIPRADLNTGNFRVSETH